MNIDIVKGHMSSAGCLGETYKSVIILNDMKSPTTVNYDHYLLAKSMLYTAENEVQLAKELLDFMYEQDFNAIAFYEIDTTIKKIRFDCLKF